MDIVNMLEHYYIPYLTSLKVVLSKFPQILLAQRSLSSGINQPNESRTFRFCLRMIKDDYDVDKRQKTEKRIQRKKLERSVFIMSILCSTCYEGSQIMDLCQELKKLPKESKAVIINLLQGNDCKPVTVKKIEDNFAKHAVHVDHDYVPGRHIRYATQMEEEASECELNQFFKQDLICCS